MTLRAFIVDDEPPARARLRQLLTDAGDVLVVGEAGDAIEARASIADARPDVVFLDVDMPQISGTALARSLPEPRPFIVFATAFEQYALEAFAVDATDYLVKPITRARLSGTLTRVRERLSRQSDLERDLAQASAAQAMLLPRAFPTAGGLNAAALTLPSRGVGGDFYLSQQIDRDRVALALGDVSGKGMPAGLIASSLQARIEAVARHGAGSASEVVGDVNRVLCATSDPSKFATLAYLELDTASALGTIVNAGHPPILLLTPGAPPRTVASTGPALGILPGARFDAHTFALDDAMTLVLYSDGVIEAVDAEGDEFGEARLLSTLEGLCAESAVAICRGVIDAVQQHTGRGAASDDLTIMVIKAQRPSAAG